MPLTPSEGKLLAALKGKPDLTTEEAAIRDVLEEKSREPGFIVQHQHHANVKGFADKVSSNTVQEYVLIGIGTGGGIELVFSHALSAPPSYAMAELVSQVSTFYKNKLQEILKAKLM